MCMYIYIYVIYVYVYYVYIYIYIYVVWLRIWIYTYMSRTEDMRQEKQLFVDYIGERKGKAVRKRTVSNDRPGL